MQRDGIEGFRFRAFLVNCRQLSNFYADFLESVRHLESLVGKRKIMDPSQYTVESAGRAVQTLSGYWAFVPSAPPQIEYSSELVLALSQADAALSELSGLGRYLPNPDLLIAPYVKREAVASSRIEGTEADLSDLLMDELCAQRNCARQRCTGSPEPRGSAAISGWPNSRSFRSPADWFAMCTACWMCNVRGEHATPGEFRKTQNWIGRPGCTLQSATYVPPPPDQMHDCLKQWEQFVNQREMMPELVQCALMHEYFEAIHPFIDGNGRIGRLLITLFLIEARAIEQTTTVPVELYRGASPGLL